MLSIKDLRNVQTIEDLESLNIGNVQYDINHRGGYVGFMGDTIADYFNINPNDLPPKFGAYVNYLGGGVRGAVAVSGFNPTLSKNKRKVLGELGAACKRVYINLEIELGLMSDDEDNPNWDAEATQAARNAGIISAY